jgi:acetyl-CoA carboxylase carboxyltransferase component
MTKSKHDDQQTSSPRPELAELRARLEGTTDAARPEAVEKRRRSGQRTTRENIDDLVDEGSFVEYGALAIAAQRQRHDLDDLFRISPADGIVCGVATVNRACFDDDRARTMVLAYDYTVFAGTQGLMGHRKLDRMLALASEWRLPIVLFAEGGGGRPNDTDMPTVAGLDTPSFLSFGALSGLVPRVGVVSGRCYAGNAALPSAGARLHRESQLAHLGSGKRRGHGGQHPVPADTISAARSPLLAGCLAEKTGVG